MSASDDLALIARVVGGLVVVLVLVAISARVARRSRHFGGAGDLQVLDRVGLSRESQLAVVRVGDRRLLIGVGPQGVTMLSTLDDDQPALAVQPVLQVEPNIPAALNLPAEPDVSESSSPPDGSGTSTGPLAGLQLPGSVQVDGFPDLASALRAAGRTTADGAPASTVSTEPPEHAEPGQGSSSWIPSPRSASEPTTDLSNATSSAPLTRAAAREDRSRRRRPGQARAASQPNVAAVNGSVLSPATWRQGIEALRELTVRRG